MARGSTQDQVLALAGIAQAAALTETLAHVGVVTAHQEAFAGTIHSLLMLDADSTESIFIDRHHLRLGLKTIKEAYEEDNKTQSNVLRYCASMMHLQKHLGRRKDMLETIASRIKQIQKQSDIAGSETHSNVVNSLAGLYQDTISTFNFRIQVSGSPSMLEQQQVANQIRACLLGGIRAVILWRQLGGSRLDFILRRKLIYDTAVSLLKA
jgi:high frequency lysogenization protein